MSKRLKVKPFKLLPERLRHYEAYIPSLKKVQDKLRGGTGGGELERGRTYWYIPTRPPQNKYDFKG